MQSQSSLAITPTLLHQLMRPGLHDALPAPTDIQEEQRVAIAAALLSLDPMEREIIQLRYDGTEFSYQDIAAHLLTSPEIVEQAEQTALAKLRGALPASRAAIASSPTMQYVALAAPTPEPAATHLDYHPKWKNQYGSALNRAPIYAYLDTHPHATNGEICRKFHIKSKTGSNIRRAWQERQPRQQGDPMQAPAAAATTLKRVRVRNKPSTAPKATEAEIFAYLDATESSNVSIIAHEFHLSLRQAHPIITAWKAARGITGTPPRPPRPKEHAMPTTITPLNATAPIFTRALSGPYFTMEELTAFLPATLIDLMTCYLARLRAQDVPDTERHATLVTIQQMAHVALQQSA